MTDTEMEAIMDDIVEGLFAVCVTLGTISLHFDDFLTKKIENRESLFTL